jgi:hypothetical protein
MLNRRDANPFGVAQDRHNSVAPTWEEIARISRSGVPGTLVRRKEMPLSGSAGHNVTLAGLPLCTPMPERLTRRFRVF